MLHKLRVVAIGAAALVALAPAGALAKTFTVDVGPPGHLPPHLDLDAFFPSAVTVHVGDAVRFQIHGFHDVAYLPPGMARPPLAIPEPGTISGDARDAVGVPFWFDSAPRLELNPAIALPAEGGTLDPARYTNSGLPSRSQPRSATGRGFMRAASRWRSCR